MKITYCEKHNLPSYEKDDGSVIHTCSVCYPEIIEKAEKPHSRLVNHGALLVNGNLCDEYTLEFLKKHAKISATVPDHASDVFFNDCIDCGHDVHYGHNDVMFVSRSKAKNRHDKRWYSTLVVFPSDDKLVLPGLNVRTAGNKLCVSNNEFTGYLLSNLN